MNGSGSEPAAPTVEGADRARRLRDLARLLPVVGVIAVVLPMLGSGRSGLSVWVYYFALWLWLVVGAFLLARRLIHLKLPQTDDE